MLKIIPRRKVLCFLCFRCFCAAFVDRSLSGSLGLKSALETFLSCQLKARPKRMRFNLCKLAIDITSSSNSPTTSVPSSQ